MEGHRRPEETFEHASAPMDIRHGILSADPASIFATGEINSGRHTILDACDGDGFLVSSPKDPSTFFLDDNDEAPTLGLGSSFEDTDFMGLGDNDFGHQDQFISHSREYSGSFPPIPEHGEFLNASGIDPSGGQDAGFAPEQFAMAQTTSPGGIMNHQQDDFGINYMQNGGLSPLKSSKGFHKVASMPNFRMKPPAGRNLGDDGHGDGDASPLSDMARSSMPPKSFSTNDLSSLASNTYDVPHSQFLTAPHLRKGKGGRQPAMDPRMDPNIDPKKARRILANRLSAAKSKMKQKSAVENLKQKIQSLEVKRRSLEEEILSLRHKCDEEERIKAELVQALSKNKTYI